MNIVEKIVISLVYLLIGHVLIIGNTKDLESNFETFMFTSFLLFLVYKTLELLYNFSYLFIKLLKDEEKDNFEIIKFSFYLILIISFSILGIIESFEPYSMLGKFGFLLPTGPIIFSYIFCVLPYKNEDGVIDYNHGKNQ